MLYFLIIFSSNSSDRSCIGVKVPFFEKHVLYLLFLKLLSLPRIPRIGFKPVSFSNCLAGSFFKYLQHKCVILCALPLFTYSLAFFEIPLKPLS